MTGWILFVPKIKLTTLIIAPLTKRANKVENYSYYRYLLFVVLVSIYIAWAQLTTIYRNFLCNLIIYDTPICSLNKPTQILKCIESRPKICGTLFYLFQIYLYSYSYILIIFVYFIQQNFFSVYLFWKGKFPLFPCRWFVTSVISCISFPSHISWSWLCSILLLAEKIWNYYYYY